MAKEHKELGVPISRRKVAVAAALGAAARVIKRHDDKAKEHERLAVEQLVLPLKKECDREWKDETPIQVVAVAANAIYWQGKEIEKLQKEVTELRALQGGANE